MPGHRCSQIGRWQNDYKRCGKYRIKIHVILQAAMANGNDAVILGALGCGAFRGPPMQIAEIFKDIINTHFPTSFAQITFAILRPNDGQQNVHKRAFQAFKDVFERPI